MEGAGWKGFDGTRRGLYEGRTVAVVSVGRGGSRAGGRGTRARRVGPRAGPT